MIEADIADAARLTRALEGIDAVTHFAASAYVGESVANPRKYFRNNVEAALKLLDAVLAGKARLFILSSTCATHRISTNPTHHRIKLPEPINPYGATKLTPTPTQPGDPPALSEILRSPGAGEKKLQAYCYRL